MVVYIKNKQKQNRQVELYQAKKVLQSKRNNQQKEKAAYRVGGNICKSWIWFIPKTYKELIQLKSKKTK